MAGSKMHDVALHPWHVVELCAGAGGLGLGIELAVLGARGIAYVEREAYAAALLVARMEAGDLAPAPIWSDLATFDARPWRGRVHCVASGDPCQGNSVAGKRLGATDDRFLIDQVVRVVAECRPLRLFRENVPGNAAGQLAALVPPLEGLGYRVECGLFSSSETGASHGRKRLFVMADRDDAVWPDEQEPVGRRGGATCTRRACGKLAHTERQHDGTRSDEPGFPIGGRADGQPRRSGRALDDAQCSERRSHGKPCGCSRPNDGDGGRHQGTAWAGASGEDMADARHARLQGRELGGPCDDERHGPGTHGSATELRRAWLPLGAPGPGDPRWPAILAAAPELEPALCRVAHAVADRVDRLRLLGNGVDPVAAGYAYLSLDARHRAHRAADAGTTVVKVAA